KNEQGRPCGAGLRERRVLSAEPRNVGNPFIASHRFLETVGAVERDAVLGVVAEWNIGIFFDELIAQAKGDVRRQLIPDGNSAAVTMEMLIDEAAGFIGMLIEYLGRKQGVADDVPDDCVPDVIEGNKVRIDPKL